MFEELSEGDSAFSDQNVGREAQLSPENQMILVK